jgi:predicted acylesterase/phospholipase RssA
MVLVMLVCWVLSGLTFFFDRFRVPVLLLMVLYGWVVAQLPQADYFYPSRPHVSHDGDDSVLPKDLAAGLDGRPLVIVAAAGGGIQAAAWTARVVAGLQQDIGIDFSRSLRLISGVSGGSVGALFIAARYDNGALPPVGPDLDQVVLDAEASGLDDVAWGLVYPDLFWSAFPVLKGVYLWPPALLQGRNLTSDRGMALENAWRARLPEDRRATLNDWRNDARRLRRPGVLFNSTLVETGERFIIGTADIAPEDGRDPRSFHGRYPDRDIEVTTAARLSATFPFVSPAARILRENRRDDVLADEPHAVDGGYYDNYGVGSVTEWLRTLREEGVTPSRIVLIVIRAWPDQEPSRHRGEHGWLFQTGSALETLYNVRGSGQLANAQLENALLHDVWGDAIVRVQFPFTLPDPDGGSLGDSGYKPPLSWHLTADDRKKLVDAWENAGQPRTCVRDLIVHPDQPAPPSCGGKPVVTASRAAP